MSGDVFVVLHYRFVLPFFEDAACLQYFFVSVPEVNASLSGHRNAGVGRLIFVLVGASIIALQLES